MSLAERQAVCSNEATIPDGMTTHGLQNTGATPMRYLVIITATQEG